MKISEILAAKETTVSLEVFPPKQWNKLSESKKTVEKLLTYQPDFVSVTYGAAGTTSGYTAEIAEDILAHGGVPLSHLTCVNSEKSMVREVIDTLEQGGIKNMWSVNTEPNATPSKFPSLPGFLVFSILISIEISPL